MKRREWMLLALLTAMYLATRFWKIEHFPIYFFCDEAIQPVLGRDLILRHFRDAQGTLLPTYFLNLRNWNLSLSVYIHALTATLFGMSITVTRGTSILVGTLAPLATAVTLRRIFGARLWWTAPLVMAVIPAWFLHSRTAFETVMATAFYAVFLLAYLLYRMDSPRWLPAVVLAGAATFYAYTNGQGLMAFSGAVLLAADWRYHLRVVRENRPLAVGTLALFLLLVAPYARFRLIDHPGAVGNQIRDLGSYWAEDIPVTRKLESYATRYLRGLDPRYWFRDDPDRPIRHRIPGRGHLPPVLAPFLALGLGLCLWRWRSPPHRTILVAVLAVPFSPAIADILITRVLSMVVPATLLAVLGADLAWRWAGGFVSARPARLALGVVLGLALTVNGLALARFCVGGGPTWFGNYGLYGMQWGARQVFGAIHERLTADPRAVLVVSHTWANNPEAFVRFFLTPSEQRRVSLFDPESHETALEAFDPNVVYVVSGDEYARLRRDSKIVCSAPLRTILYPDGRPGFLFLRLDYAPEAAEIFAAEEAERRRPRTDMVTVAGEEWSVQHPKLDIGSAADALDDNPATVARSARVNPAVWVIGLPSPRPLAGVELELWASDYDVTVTVRGGDGRIVNVSRRFRNLPLEPRVRIDLPRVVPDARHVRVSIRKVDVDAFVHLRGLRLLPPGDTPG